MQRSFPCAFGIRFTIDSIAPGQELLSMVLRRARTFCIRRIMMVDAFSLGRTWTWFVCLYRLLASLPGLGPPPVFVLREASLLLPSSLY